METAPFHRLDDGPQAPARAFWLRADDGVRLRAAHWAAGDARGSVLLFPGRTEYVEKYAPVAAFLNAEGFDVIAIDWRGQGMSDRLQADPRPGHVGEFADYQRDVIELMVAAGDLDLPKPWHLLGHSMGGCIGLCALENGLPVASAVFSAPMWGINLRRLNTGIATGIAYLAGRMGRGGFAAPGTGGGASAYPLAESFNANLLTHDVDEWARLLREAAAWPDLTIGGASFDWVGKALNECSRLARIAAPDIPMTVSLGSEEKIISHQAIRDRTANWPDARLLLIEGARHEVMMETPDLKRIFWQGALERFAGV
ncbi:alpha/beta hydrolase [Paracoccus sp. 1_MG-2023]|uniref:alpha/beta fold hydrolase n=1 Tax=unclassified Paracoccus (in: a-proteobacteria) TaxID=2688777 RepID=UPI001C08BA7F|nr:MULTISPECIES: alpha/beta hydrolase [unclassified Paracoccus (in: a-proteobacteria)]MBU2956734.1 alpha/beta hydrolase [Paracoccus sp. C2R09]MDO6669226.1 alpha/beta hydrolase [Paracoccus sp. 1_MG-2023]